MYQWPADFAMAAPDSQATSPMSMQPMPSQAHYNMAALSDAAPEHHHHEQQQHLHLKDEIPEAPEPYWGSFGVSTTEADPVDGQAQHMHQDAYHYMNNMQHTMGHMNQTLAPSALVKQEESSLPLDLDMHHQHQQQQQMMITHPLMHMHDPIAQSRRDSQASTEAVSPDDTIKDEYAPSVDIGASLKLRRQQQQQSNGNRIFRKPRVRGGARSVAGPTPRRDGVKSKQHPAAIKSEPSPEDSVEEKPTTIEPLQFKDGMPDTDRFLFELRRKYDNNKGKGMWDPITREYNERFNTQFDRAALQMRISRAKSKYVQWSDNDDQRLIEAARLVERQYYRQVHLKYKELGGNPQADFNVGNVEMRMVELGLAEVFMEPWKGDAKSQTRRRRKLNERQRASAASREEARDAPPDAACYPPQQQQQPDYLAQHHHYQQQLAAAQNERSHYGTSELPPHTQEQVLDEIEARGYPIEEDSDSEAKGDSVLVLSSKETIAGRKGTSGQSSHSGRAAKQRNGGGGMGMSLS